MIMTLDIDNAWDMITTYVRVSGGSRSGQGDDDSSGDELHDVVVLEVECLKR